ncbi:MAG: TIGR04013 family B12-binding domain/radical SAM domain-containing protein [Candidatus Aquicultor sp.]
MDVAVAFVCANYNKYSINALAGAVESTPGTASTALYFLDTRTGDELTASVGELGDRHDAVLVCFSFATTNIVPAFKQLRALKDEVDVPGVMYVAGGPHATGVPDEVLALGFDIVVIGEAEESFPELIGAFIDGSDWRQVKGIAFKHDGAVVKTGRRTPVDLNRFAPFSLAHYRLSPIEISRGCPHACRFCQTSFIFGARMRHRGVEEILKYISLSKENGMNDFRFISPNALAYGSVDGRTVNFEAVEGLLKRASGITGKNHLFFGSFPSEVRPEAISREAVELITGYTATKQLVIGAQTGSERMLASLNRQHSVGDVYTAVELILAAGLEVSVDFIFGLPAETDEDRRLSIAMIEDLTGMGAKVHSHTFIPLPGTPLASAETGTVDEELARYLSRLANRGLQFGQWKKQQELAKQASAFRWSHKS